jgi:hypothetical protein
LCLAFTLIGGKVTMANDDLTEWATKQRDDALRQIELFGDQVAKAQLVMPDGTTQDITAGVLSHQKANAEAFERLITALKG